MNTCPGCGLTLPAVEGPVHAYVATSPECWALYTQHLHTQTERLFTDGYMTQHPDGDDPRQVQSVAVHLITLQAVLRDGQPRSKAHDITVAAVNLGRDMGGYRILAKPVEWPWTIADVIAGRADGLEYVAAVLTAWRATEGDQIEAWTEETLQQMYS